VEHFKMILLDTHVLVWALAAPERLSKVASLAIRRAQTGGGLAVAAITLWELAVLVARGRIQGYGTVDDSVRLLTQGVVVKPITAAIAAIAAEFPSQYPRDPADRLIGATAKAEGIPLLTRDQKLLAVPMLQTIW
jgi:PIN domain nuclease of toxin-antitoxin system